MVQVLLRQYSGIVINFTRSPDPYIMCGEVWSTYQERTPLPSALSQLGSAIISDNKFLLSSRGLPIVLR